jgi:hypothetical protein
MISTLLPYLNVLQAIAVIVTLAIVAWQTVLFVRQTKLNTIISYHQYYKDIDTTLLQNPELAESLLAACRRERSSGHVGRFVSACVLQGTGGSDSMEHGR